MAAQQAASKAGARTIPVPGAQQWQGHEPSPSWAASHEVRDLICRNGAATAAEVAERSGERKTRDGTQRVRSGTAAMHATRAWLRRR